MDRLELFKGVLDAHVHVVILKLRQPAAQNDVAVPLRLGQVLLVSLLAVLGQDGVIGNVCLLVRRVIGHRVLRGDHRNREVLVQAEGELSIFGASGIAWGLGIGDDLLRLEAPLLGGIGAVGLLEQQVPVFPDVFLLAFQQLQNGHPVPAPERLPQLGQQSLGPLGTCQLLKGAEVEGQLDIFPVDKAQKMGVVGGTARRTATGIQ